MDYLVPENERGQTPSVSVKEKTVCPTISCLVKGVGVMMESPSYEWAHRPGISDDVFTCESEELIIILSYNYVTSKFDIASDLFTSSSHFLRQQEKEYLLEKLTKRFPKNSYQRKNDEDEKKQQRLDRIAKLGCPSL